MTKKGTIRFYGKDDILFGEVKYHSRDERDVAIKYFHREVEGWEYYQIAPAIYERERIPEYSLIIPKPKKIIRFTPNPFETKFVRHKGVYDNQKSLYKELNVAPMQ
jgi:hypothetical protein